MLCSLIFCKNPEKGSDPLALRGATFGTPCGINKVSYDVNTCCPMTSHHGYIIYNVGKLLFLDPIHPQRVDY